jgi:biopolymer transport protein ExbB/TolQ
MTRVQWTLVAVMAVVFAFALGFGWQYARASRAERSLEQATLDLSFKRLEATLSASALQAAGGSYEAARGLASDFFNGLQRNIHRAPADDRAELAAILGQRDEVITLLSRAQPTAPEVVARLAEQFRAALEGPEMPMPEMPAGQPTP